MVNNYILYIFFWEMSIQIAHFYQIISCLLFYFIRLLTYSRNLWSPEFLLVNRIWYKPMYQTFRRNNKLTLKVQKQWFQKAYNHKPSHILAPSM
jgi:hypothetical protein